jgi:SAM-dependent methyltransferase
MSEHTEHAQRNQAQWDTWAKDYVAAAERHWAENDPMWGIWEVPEADLRTLPEPLEGRDAVELGCGTAYWGSYLARRGARVTGVDLSERQLETARRLQREHGVEFPLVQASAEAVPLPDAAFDLALSEYGASLWCDPDLWLAEAARLLRPGGRLVFLTNSPLSMICTPLDGSATTERLERPQFGMKRFEWPEDDDNSTEFHLPHGEMIAVLRRCGFDVEALHELQAPEDARPSRFEFVSKEWSRRWPCEEVWVARRA